MFRHVVTVDRLRTVRSAVSPFWRMGSQSTGQRTDNTCRLLFNLVAIHRLLQTQQLTFFFIEVGRFEQRALHNNASQLRRQRPGRRALAVTTSDFSRYAGNHCMADRFTDDTQYLPVITNQLRPFGINLTTDIGQQGVSQIVFKAAAVDGGVEARTDDRLPRHPLRHLAPVLITQLWQFDIVRIIWRSVGRLIPPHCRIETAQRPTNRHGGRRRFYRVAIPQCAQRF
ncbi:hypothetical protein D3C73_796300 [compost metagenome]